MSIRIMTHVWEHQGVTPTQKLVLLALADWANDEGLCWPSIEKLCKKSCLSRRAVQTAIKSLSDIGLLIQEQLNGRGCKYWLKIGVQEMHGCSKSTSEVQEMHTRGAAGAPNTSYTHQDTSIDTQSDDGLTVDEVVNAWNNLAKDRDLPKVLKITPARRKQIQARIREYDHDDWSTALTAIYKSKFLCGDNDRGWKANIDFLLQPSSFVKLIEGAYSNER